MSERSVGLVVLTDIPGIGICAVLRERGYFNPEKMQAESWPGACQVTAHGKLEAKEDFHIALDREVREELGETFAWLLSQQIFSEDYSVFKEVSRLRKQDKEVVTFAIKIESDLLKEIRLSPESGGIRLLRASDTYKIVDVTSFSKAEGVPDRKTIAMFPDEKEAVIKAFDLFSYYIVG